MTIGRIHLGVLIGLVAVVLDPATAAAATAGAATSANGFVGGGARIALFALGGLALAAVVAASVEVIFRTVREGKWSSDTAPVLSALTAHRYYTRVLYGLAPAGVAGGIVLVRGERIAAVVFLFAVMTVTATALRANPRPLHLMPIARVAFNASVPAAGLAIALIPGAFGEALISGRTAVAALAAAVVTTFMADWLETRFETDRPVWTAVIGSASFANKLASEIQDTDIRGYKVVGYIGEELAGQSTGVPWLGSLEDVRSAVRDKSIDLLVIAPQARRLEVFERAARECLDLQVRMIEATALYEDLLGHVPIGTINSAWFQFIMHPRYSPASPLSKRALDLLVSGLMLVGSAPIMLLCALAIKLEDRGPVYYRQRRVGEEGREFDMVKFRMLRPDADDLWATMTEEELLTRVGRVLRKTHLNELPQLWQIFRGEMSLVGPRPEPPQLVNELSGLVPYYERRALVKPGLTGWAQVRCGYAGSRFGTAWKMCHDLYYIKHRSVAFDLLVLLQTVHVLVERDREEQLPAKDFILGDTVEFVGR
jgi:exopolysaccharide biosynthesis polyprenyl glycosylphosphotransferase